MTTNLTDLITSRFDRERLADVCIMPEREFAHEYGMETVTVPQKYPDDFYAFRDDGSDILAVAHLDTVASSWERQARFLNTAGGEVVYSRALDDRLGAYVILELLPQLGITHDILLTVGEECGMSTASFFDDQKGYNWIIEFDRGGTDVVMYDYEDKTTRDLVKASGARVGDGIFSDICYLESLGVKAFNWGVGYRDYHGPRSHAYLDDTFMMVEQYLEFHAANSDMILPHTPDKSAHWWDDDKLEDEDDDMTHSFWTDEDRTSRAAYSWDVSS